MAALTITDIRMKGNLPPHLKEDKIQYHIDSARQERASRCGFSTYTGTDYEWEYEEIIFHLTMKRIYRYENIFFVDGISDNTTDLLANRRLFNVNEIDALVAREEESAAKYIADCAREYEESTSSTDIDYEGISSFGAIGLISVGGNQKYINEPRNFKEEVEDE